MPAPRRRREWVDLWRAAWALLRTKIGVAFILFVVAVAVFGPYLAPHSPTQFVDSPFHAPTGTATLGTDFLGRDVLSRVLYGGRTTLVLALLATAIGEVVGIFFGTPAPATAGVALMRQSCAPSTWCSPSRPSSSCC